MTSRHDRMATVMAASILVLAACAQESKAPAADIVQNNTKSSAQDLPAFEYVQMDAFNRTFGEFVGLVEGESFAQSEPKINAVFTAYEGHADPHDIRMETHVVEGDWTQVLVTQDGLMDGTIAGQQLLAVYDENGGLVTYGMRIKCHTENNASAWQNTLCE